MRTGPPCAVRSGGCVRRAGRSTRTPGRAVGVDADRGWRAPASRPAIRPESGWRRAGAVRRSDRTTRSAPRRYRSAHRSRHRCSALRRAGRAGPTGRPRRGAPPLRCRPRSRERRRAPGAATCPPRCAPGRTTTAPSARWSAGPTRRARSSGTGRLLGDQVLVGEHLTDRVPDRHRTGDRSPRSWASQVRGAVGQRAPDRRPQHAERLARWVWICMATGVHRRDLRRGGPPRVVEGVELPTVAVLPGVERLQRQARDVARYGHSGPRPARVGRPDAVAHHPVVTQQRLEHDRSRTEGVGGWYRCPPRGRSAEVASGERDGVLATVQMWGQVDHVVVRGPRVGAHRAPCDLDAVDPQHVPAVDPQSCRGHVRDRIQGDGPTEQTHLVERLAQHGPGRGLGGECRSFEPDPAGPPARTEGEGMADLHRWTPDGEQLATDVDGR